MPSFNIYVPSYRRSNRILTAPFLDYCVYVVRESERDAYKDAGVEVLPVEDHRICSIAKVQNWIIENAEEDVVCVLDDDIENFFYRLEKNERINDPQTVTREIERLGQLAYDLGVGVLGSCIAPIPWGYKAEFRFSGMIGPIRYYNREKVKARYIQMPFFGDTDFVLQELLQNRIILRPDYFVTDAKIETNAGGMNLKRTKQIQIDTFDTIMKPKWGKYVSFNPKKNITVISVKR